VSDTPITPSLTERTAREIREHSTFFWVTGIVSVIAGAVAIFAPLAATFAANIVIGCCLGATGIAQATLAFKHRRKTRIASNFLLGALAMVAGLGLVVFPAIGILAIAFVLAAYFTAGGLLKLFFAWKARPAEGAGWIAASGAASVILGLLIWLGLPANALWVLGLLVGIDLIFFGTILISLIVRAKDRAGADTRSHGTAPDDSKPGGAVPQEGG